MLLKQSTAHTFRLGPFVDSTDGDTEENALTIAASSVLLSKAGGALSAKNEATALTSTGANAHYTCVLDATDTGTLGNLRVWCHVAGALPVLTDFTVVPANVYDSLVGGSDNLNVELDTIKGQTVTCGAGVTILASVGTAATSTAQTGDSYALANGANGFVAIKGDTAAILTDTNELQTDWVNGGRLDLILDARAAEAAVAALENISAADVLAQVQAALDEAFVDGTALTANGLKDRIRRAVWILQNKLQIVDATGAITVFKDDSITAALQGGTVTDDSTDTIRTRIS